jgi:hypothetical protein
VSSVPYSMLVQVSRKSDCEESTSNQQTVNNPAVRKKEHAALRTGESLPRCRDGTLPLHVRTSIYPYCGLYRESTLRLHVLQGSQSLPAAALL